MVSPLDRRTFKKRAATPPFRSLRQRLQVSVYLRLLPPNNEPNNPRTN